MNPTTSQIADVIDQHRRGFGTTEEQLIKELTEIGCTKAFISPSGDEYLIYYEKDNAETFFLYAPKQRLIIDSEHFEWDRSVLQC